ncbi:unnamed protein product [Amoebophrya sp. A25]|nr:unnamed protein product [Amoebophrya sp. A25]|eukprot:GSA25T00010677001.1
MDEAPLPAQGDALNMSLQVKNSNAAASSGQRQGMINGGGLQLNDFLRTDANHGGPSSSTTTLSSDKNRAHLPREDRSNSNSTSNLFTSRTGTGVNNTLTHQRRRLQATVGTWRLQATHPPSSMLDLEIGSRLVAVNLSLASSDTLAKLMKQRPINAIFLNCEKANKVLCLQEEVGEASRNREVENGTRDQDEASLLLREELIRDRMAALSEMVVAALRENLPPLLPREEPLKKCLAVLADKNATQHGNASLGASSTSTTSTSTAITKINDSAPSSTCCSVLRPGWEPQQACFTEQQHDQPIAASRRGQEQQLFNVDWQLGASLLFEGDAVGGEGEADEIEIGGDAHKPLACNVDIIPEMKEKENGKINAVVHTQTSEGGGTLIGTSEGGGTSIGFSSKSSSSFRRRPTPSAVERVPATALRRIMAFVGDLPTIAGCCCLSRSWFRALWQEKLWQWVLRHGAPLPDNVRPGFWRWLARKHTRRRVANTSRGGPEDGRSDPRGSATASFSKPSGKGEASSSRRLGVVDEDEKLLRERDRESAALLCLSYGPSPGGVVRARAKRRFARLAGFADAFDCLDATGILTSTVFFSNHTSKGKAVVLCRQFQAVLCGKSLQLFRHFFGEGVAPELWFFYQVQDLFLDWRERNGISRTDFLRIWDVFLFEGSWKMVLRIIVTFLHEHEAELRTRLGSCDRIMADLFDGGKGKGSGGRGFIIMKEALAKCKVTKSLLGHIAECLSSPSCT